MGDGISEYLLNEGAGFAVDRPFSRAHAASPTRASAPSIAVTASAR